MSTLTLKRGDALAFIIRRVQADGSPATGLAASMLSQVRSASDALMGTFVITETSTPGDYDFYIPATVTKDWPVGMYDFDIEYTDTGRPISSETHRIRVVKDVSRL